MATDLGQASILIVPRFDGLTKSVDKALGAAGASASASGSGLGEKAASGFGRGLLSQGAVVGAFSQLTIKAMDTISSHVSSAVSRFDTLNNYPKVMQSLGYSADEAQASIGKMSDRLQALPTKLDDMVSLTQGIVTVTGDLGKATDVGLALNDMLVASGSSTQLTTAAMEQFRQILAKGKPEMEDWRSLTSAMPGQMDQLAKAMLGPTANANDLYAALGGGKNDPILSMDQLMDKMVELDQVGGDSFQSFQAQAETAAGGVQTSLDNLSNAVTKGIAATMDAVGQQNIAGVINDAKDVVKGAFSAFNSGVSRALPLAKQAYGLAKEALPTVLAISAANVGITKLVGAGSSAVGVAKSAAEAFGLWAGGAGTLSESLSACGFNPAAIAIGAVSVAVGLAAKAYVDLKTHTDNLSKATGGLSEAVDRASNLDSYRGRLSDVGEQAGFTAQSVGELAESIDKSVDSMNETTQQAETQIATLETARTIVGNNVGQTDLSTEAQGRLTWALQELNDQLGTNITQQDVLNGYYEDASGVTQDLRKSVDELVAAKENEARVDAISQNLTEAYKQQSAAADTLADAQNRYNDAVQRYVDKGYDLEQARSMATMGTQEGRDLQEAQRMYDQTSDSVKRLSESLGDAGRAASDSATPFDEWASSTGPLFESQVQSHGQSLSDLKQAFSDLGVNVEDLENLSDESLETLARDFDGTAASIVDDLDGWSVGMDESAKAAARAAASIEDALNGMDLGDALSGAGADVDTFAQKLAGAGVSTETLNAIGSENLAELADACGGNMDAMVWYIQNYNSTPIVDKDGNVSVDDAQLIDAQGRVWTWNGSQLVDKDGNAAVEDTSLSDAQGNLWTWNGTALVSKDGSVSISENGVDKALSDRSDWNSGSWLDKAANATISVVRTVTDFFTGGHASGGIRTHADGGFAPRMHAGGAIATRAAPLDIVGEAGAEAIVPLTNKRYSEPFARTIAEQMGTGGEDVIAWLAKNLGPIISQYSPERVVTDREARRYIKGVLA